MNCETYLGVCVLHADRQTAHNYMKVLPGLSVCQQLFLVGCYKRFRVLQEINLNSPLAWSDHYKSNALQTAHKSNLKSPQ